MQDIKEIEKFYETEDPWNYQTTHDDLRRLDQIMTNIPKKKYKKAVDLGCGEGWITQYLPASKIYGYDVSKNALARLPEKVEACYTLPNKKFDLIIATGVMYKHYNFRELLDYIKSNSVGFVLLSNIKDWEVEEVAELGEPLSVIEYPYREYTQIMRTYDFAT